MVDGLIVADFFPKSNGRIPQKGISAANRPRSPSPAQKGPFPAPVRRRERTFLFGKSVLPWVPLRDCIRPDAGGQSFCGSGR